jgi:hypothetical protein
MGGGYSKGITDHVCLSTNLKSVWYLSVIITRYTRKGHPSKVTKAGFDQMVCHHPDPMPFVQGQDQKKKMLIKFFWVVMFMKRAQNFFS